MGEAEQGPCRVTAGGVSFLEPEEEWRVAKRKGEGRGPSGMTAPAAELTIKLNWRGSPAVTC